MSEPRIDLQQLLRHRYRDDGQHTSAANFTATVAREIDAQPCNPLRDEDGDWGEDDSLGNVPLREGVSPPICLDEKCCGTCGPICKPENHAGSARHPEASASVTCLPVLEFEALLGKRYPLEKLAAVGHQAFTANLTAVLPLPMWRRARGALRWWWMWLRGVLRGRGQT